MQSKRRGKQIAKEEGFSSLSIRRRCILLGISRSPIYYNHAQEKEENLKSMELIEKRYFEDPAHGARGIKAYLQKEYKFRVNLKGVKRLMKKMFIQGIYPTPKRTISQNTNYSNLLKALFIFILLQTELEFSSGCVNYKSMEGGKGNE